MIPSSVARIGAMAALVPAFVGPDLLAAGLSDGRKWDGVLVAQPMVLGLVAAGQRDPQARRLLVLLTLVASAGTIAALAVGPGPLRLGVALAKAAAALALLVLARRSALPTEPDGLR